LREIFAGLKEDLLPIIREIDASRDTDDSFLTGDFDPGRQREFGLQILRHFGYTEQDWRLDQTQHPFMSSPGTGDIRLTSDFRPTDLSSLFAAMHEFGHGAYEWGIDRALVRTPLGTGVSLALHESQSRLWENLLGRSRSFWRFFYPRLQETFLAQLR
jgi:carboxypeptidase Taq